MADNSVINEIVSKQADEQFKKLLKDLDIGILKVQQLSEGFRSIQTPSETKKFIKEVNDELKRGNKITTDAEAAQKRLASAQRNYNIAASSTGKRIQEVRSKTNQLNRENRALLGAYSKLRLQLSQAEERYRNLSVELGRNARETRAAQREVLQYRNALDSINKPIGRFNDNVGRYTSAVKGFINAFGVVGGVYLFARAIQDAGKTIVDFDKQLIAVGKTTNISGDALRSLGDDAIALGLQLKGISIQGLLQTAEVAGQLGIEGSENILKFSKTIEQLRLTSDVAGEEGARNFAQFINVSSDSVENSDKLGSVITDLGNSFATTESQILETSTEIQKGISIYNTSAQSVLGLGAATSALGNQAESTRSAMQTTFAVIDNGLATGTNLNKILKLTGQTQEELSKQFKTDAVGSFKLFIKGLSDAQKEGKNLRVILNELDITEKRAVTVVGSLVQNYDELEKALDKANNAYSENIALTEEANASAESLSSKIGDVADAWDGFILSVEDGSGFLSRVFKGILGFTEELIDGLTQLALSEEQRRKAFDRRDGDIAYLKVQEKIRNSAKETGKSIEELATIKADDVDSEIKASESLQAKRKEELKSIQEKIKKDKELLEIVKKTGVETTRSQKDIASQIFINEARERKLNESIENGNSLIQIRLQELKAAEDLEKAEIKRKKDLSDAFVEVTDKEDENNKKKKQTIENVKNSIGFYEDLIRKLQEKQKALSDTSEEYADFENQIRFFQFLIKEIKGDFEQLNEPTLQGAFQFFDNIEDSESDLEAMKELVLTTAKEIGADLDAIKIQVDQADTVDDLEKLYNKLLEAQQNYNDKRKELQEELNDNLKDLATNLGEALFTIQQNRIDEEIDENNRRYDAILSNERLSQEERASIEAQREAEENRLLEKKKEIARKEFLIERGAALAEIAIDTISKVAAIKAQAAVLAANPATAALAPLALAQIPLVIGSGAVAAGAIIATAIPAFAEGKKKTDNYTGVGLAGEAGNTEYQFDKNNNLIGVYDEPTYIHTKSGDTILKDTPSFKKYVLDNSLMGSIKLNSGFIPPLVKIDLPKEQKSESDKLLRDIHSTLKRQKNTFIANVNVKNSFDPKVNRGNNV